ncbi:5'-phosphate synthase pdxT subunit [Clostridium amylolyticum]|uniref:Pyridoxal 5'-phosphate synthase subunit PdxT n=1 Tax=Clostridium amylolyticum TaxID=1121298 RepID=A0A1M6HBB0_9CLOT|nr:5'-phosphate synthase pdxT subunit [Clostridium amylolyticum]
MSIKIGVLAVQGAFIEHINALKKLNVEAVEIRQLSDLTNNEIHGLILPGGESTVMGKLLKELNIFGEMQKLIKDGLPVLGTCAGVILLAKTIANDEKTHLSTMDITVKRNAYGRQLGSFKTLGNFKGIGEIPMTFIRAPYIERVSENVEVLSVVNNQIVAAKQDNMIVTTFHPELTEDLKVHEYFVESI